MFKKLSDHLNLLMAKARINSSELARQTGLPATTIKRLRNNEQSNPTVATLLPIAQYFSLTISELLNCESLISKNRSSSNNLKAIPLLNWQECSQIIDSIPEQESTVYTEKSVSDKAFALMVETQDLTYFPHKSVLIVDPMLKASSGDYVIVTKANSQSAVIKKYIIETDQVYLKSMVSGLGIVPLTPEFTILGVILQYKLELKTQ